jgi:hypothetical protein
MCGRRPRMPEAPKPVQVAAYDNTEADIEARLRRRRAGAAANVLTGAGGIPATPTLGGVAA